MKGQKVVWLVVTSVFLLVSLVARPVAADEGADAGADGDAPTKAPRIDSKIHAGPGRISCYKCSSDKDKACTHIPSGEAIQQDSCKHANTLAKEWFTSRKLIKSEDAEKLFNDEKGPFSGKGEDVTCCAFFYSAPSNEKVKQGLDKLKGLLGSTDATPTAGIDSFERDCVTAPSSVMDRCVPILKSSRS